MPQDETSVSEAEVEAATKAIERVPLMVGTYSMSGDDAVALALAALTAAAQVRAQAGPRNSAEWFSAIQAILPAGYSITKTELSLMPIYGATED